MTMAGLKRTLSKNSEMLRQDMERQRYHGRIDRGIRWGRQACEPIAKLLQAMEYSHRHHKAGAHLQ